MARSTYYRSKRYCRRVSHTETRIALVVLYDWFGIGKNGGHMELLLSRSQKTGFGMGAPVFVLNVRAQLTDEEADYVEKYKLGKTVLYEKASVREKLDQPGAFKQLMTAVSARAMGKIFTVNNLVDGRKIECRDILEMLEVEHQIKSMADAFHTILMTCGNFDGEEVITFPRDE